MIVTACVFIRTAEILMSLITVALSDPCKDCSLCQNACYVI